MAQRKPETPPVVLVPTASSFDFLSGGFARSQRSRISGGALIGGALVVLVAVGALGMHSNAARTSQQAILDVAQTEHAAVSAELAQIDQAEGIASETIKSHVAERTSALQAAIGDEIDNVRLLHDLTASTPPGLTLTSIDFATTKEDATADAEEAPAPAARQMAVTATATNFALIDQWATNLRTISGLNDVSVTWTGGGDAIKVTATGVLSPQAFTARATESGNTLPPAPADAGAVPDPGILDAEELGDAPGPDDINTPDENSEDGY